MRNTFIDTIIGECQSRDDIFIISGDAGLGVFDEFQKQYPDRFLNLGVAEQNTIGCAAGMALAGFRVYVYNIAPFVLYRCYEQVRNDICYQQLPVTLIGIGSGLTYAPMGMTHYSVEDLGITQTLPNLRVFSPADPVEAELAAHETLTGDFPTYVRLAKRGEPRIHTSSALDITQPIKMAEGRDVSIVFHGTVVNEVLAARNILAGKGISVQAISLPMVAPCPFEALNTMLANIGTVVSVEEHFVDSGLGARLAFWSALHRPEWRLSCLGITPEYIHKIKTQEGMRQFYGLSAEGIAAHVCGLLEGL
jgi:transketolase